MKNLRDYARAHRRALPAAIIGVGALGALMLYHLGSLTGGLATSEQQVAQAAYGWHGIYRDPSYLPLTILRSVIFLTLGHHDQLLVRLPNALLGALASVCFGILIRLWHGNRTAVLASVLFATSAWTLHVSRLASNDVVYLGALPVLLLTQLALQRRAGQKLVFYGVLLLWGILLYVPGLIWLLIISVVASRNSIKQGWLQLKTWWQRVLAVLAILIWLPLLIHGLLRLQNLRRWAGLPNHFAHPLAVAKQFAGVPAHLLIRGPENPVVWLGQAPLLDIFTLVMAVLGVYFYALHWKAARSQLLLSLLFVGWLLIGADGPVGLSVLVPLLYISAAAGIAYLLRQWLQVFPSNPLARGLGIGIVVVAISLSCAYNLRAYFVAWPNDPATVTTFHHYLQ